MLNDPLPIWQPSNQLALPSVSVKHACGVEFFITRTTICLYPLSLICFQWVRWFWRVKRWGSPLFLLKARRIHPGDRTTRINILSCNSRWPGIYPWAGKKECLSQPPRSSKIIFLSHKFNPRKNSEKFKKDVSSLLFTIWSMDIELFLLYVTSWSP